METLVPAGLSPDKSRNKNVPATTVVRHLKFTKLFKITLNISQGGLANGNITPSRTVSNLRDFVRSNVHFRFSILSKKDNIQPVLMTLVTVIMVGDLASANWSFYTKFTSLVSNA